MRDYDIPGKTGTFLIGIADGITAKICPECGGELLCDDEICQFCASNAMHRKWYPQMYQDDDA